MVECCNTLDVTCHICNSDCAIFGLSYEIRGWVFLFVLLLHTCSSHASEQFPRCLFCNPTLLRPSAYPFCLFLCAGVKLSRNEPRFSKWPWYTTGRPPVKFHAIWGPFDSPTVNQASCVLQPNTTPKRPNNPSKPLPCPPPSDHDHVSESYTPFGHSYLLLAINMCTPSNFRVLKP